ncbi:MAG: dehydrogenase [Verrucomicrobiales bacterium]|nr:dehydrogenase [Verrucomicrobiales bacterium]|tara:strand:+ start:744 stop:2096 length:1353 start_codon:yes stop_codon:yes gene_type:complete
MKDSKKTQEQDDLNRRKFVGNTSKTVAGAAALSTLPIERFAHAAISPGDTIKVGLIGCGGRGTGAAVQALSTSESTKLVAMADVFKDKLENRLGIISKQKEKQVDVKDENKFVGPDGYKKVIEQSDLVILTTPPGFRPYHFEEAIKQNKHVFMEKPVAVDGPGVRKVLEVAKIADKKGLKVGVGLQRHHQAGYVETMKRLKDGAIGDFVSMRAYWNGGGVWDPRAGRGEVNSELEYQLRNWYYYNWLCGDHITEQHIHNLDIINWLKDGYPVLARGMGGRQVRTDKKYGEIFDHHAVEYQYEDGTWMFSQCRHIRGCWNSVSEHVQGTKGRCDINRHSIFPTKGNPWRYRKQKGDKNPYQQEHDDLFAAIRHNEPYNEAYYGAMSTLTSIMGRMATYTGQPVTQEQALNSKVQIMPDKITWDTKPPTGPDKDGKYPIPVPGDKMWARKIV